MPRLPALRALAQNCEHPPLERREDLALRPELRDQRRVGQAQIHDLDRDALLEGSVGAMRPVDRRHAAARDQRVDLVVAEAQPDVADWRPGRPRATGPPR